MNGAVRSTGGGSIRVWQGYGKDRCLVEAMGRLAYWTLAERAIGYSEEAREKRRAGDYSRTSSASRTSEASEDGRKARGEEDPNTIRDNRQTKEKRLARNLNNNHNH